MLTKRDAKKEGARAGHAAATWFEPSDRVIEMIEDGDPEADEYMPRRPNLSGEFAGESMNEILGVEADDDPDDVDEIANIWEAAAQQAYDEEINRAIRIYMKGRRRETPPRGGRRSSRSNPRGGPRVVTHRRRR